MKPTRPALRWHGGKWLLAPWIISNFPEHKIYVEPFGGGMSVLLRKPRSYAEVYNDLDGEVVHFFKMLRSDETGVLIRQISMTPFAREEFNEAYLPTNDPIERARRMLVRSHMGFGSDSVGKSTSTSRGFRPGTGFRANSNRSGTTPAHDWANFPPALKAIIERIKGVVIENRQATDCMFQHDSPWTLHYVDPPYPHDVRSQKGRGEYAHEMSIEQHVQLVETLKNLKGMVVISGYRHPIYTSLGWESVEKRTYADGARKRIEQLWLNPAAAKFAQGKLL